MVAVYGRRRVGKTFLIKEFFHNEFDFVFTGSYETPTSVQLALFHQELQKHTKQELPIPKNWFEAFDRLRVYLGSLSKERIVLFFDELPWIDTPKSNFLTAFSYFWNNWASTRDGLKLFICGSSTSWMMDKIIGAKGGLYNRCSHTIYLSPFTLNEVEQQLQHRGIVWTRYQITEAYMIFGGIPYYIDMLDKSQPFAQNIDNLFFRQGAPLRTEYEFLFRSLFKEATLHRQIIEVLSSSGKGLTLQEIKDELGLSSGGTITKVLKDLQLCDFIRAYKSIGKQTKGMMYQLTDLFTLFHLRFVANNNGQDHHFWSNMRENPSRMTWRGYAFEQVCLQHIPQIKEAIGIKAVLSNVCSWSCPTFIDNDGNEWKGTQIDLLIDRRDEVINVCEMKFANDTYIIDKDYEVLLRRRLTTFRHLTRTRKALHLTMITTYGISQNSHSGDVQAEVTMDDLFDR